MGAEVPNALEVTRHEAAWLGRAMVPARHHRARVRAARRRLAAGMRRRRAGTTPPDQHAWLSDVCCHGTGLSYLNWRWAALPPSAWLFLMPALFITLLPFAMMAGVDAIRCHEAWPDHMQRRAAFKLVAVVTVWMVIGGGWVVPKMNQRWQNAVDSANASQRVATLTRVDGLSTHELLTASDPASRSTVLILPGERRRELEHRVSFALLPVLLFWIRWRLLDVGSTGWFVPLPLSVIGAMATSGVILLRALLGPLGSAVSPRQYVGIWITVLLFIAASVVGRRSGRRVAREGGAG